MRGTVAKRIRREVYGDNALQTEYDLKVHQKLMKLFVNKKRKKRPITVLSKGLRKAYQARKRAYMRGECPA